MGRYRAPLHQPLLRVPPFPGARPSTLVRAGVGRHPASEAELDEAMAGISAVKVGGDYWARQPSLPPRPYVLVKVRSRHLAVRLFGMIGSHPILCWSDDAEAPRRGPGITVISGRYDPWHIVRGASEVWSERDDEVVAIATLAGVPVRDPDGTKVQFAELREFVRTRLFGFGEYVCPFTGATIGVTEAIELCTRWRDLIDSNRPIAAAVGFATWKQATAAPLLWPGSGDVPFSRKPQVEKGDCVAAWKSRADGVVIASLERARATLMEVEDGFIRSIGLGANCVPPFSLVVDHRGIYFDPGRTSDLEQLLISGVFGTELLARASALIALIVETGVSKYGAGRQVAARRSSARHVLVPGQVEDDRSVQCGGGVVTTNVELLRRARADAPDAYILYKPHPDVEAGHRVGAIPDALALGLVDEVVRDLPIAPLIQMVDEVHVNTSLAGFESLLRGKPVTTHGVPFYAGWGLTRDLGNVPGRRGTGRSLEELVAASLLIYPRYLDPVSGLPCTPEILVRRLAEGSATTGGNPLVPLRRLQGLVKRALARLAWERVSG